MAKRFKGVGYMCSSALYFEVGHTDVTIYPRRSEALKKNKCIGRSKLHCRLVQVEVTEAPKKR